MLVAASGLSPYGGLYRDLSVPADGNRWGPSMDNLLPMCERKLSLPRSSLSSRRGLRFHRLAGRLPEKACLHQLLIGWRISKQRPKCGCQSGFGEDVRITSSADMDILTCGYWSAICCAPHLQHTGAAATAATVLPRPSQESQHTRPSPETRCCRCRACRRRGCPGRSRERRRERLAQSALASAAGTTGPQTRGKPALLPLGDRCGGTVPLLPLGGLPSLPPPPAPK